MTQHIKTHFKARGINSLANNPATLARVLENYQSEELNSMVASNNAYIDTNDNDTNRYDGEIREDESKEEEDINPC